MAPSLTPTPTQAACALAGGEERRGTEYRPSKPRDLLLWALTFLAQEATLLGNWSLFTLVDLPVEWMDAANSSIRDIVEGLNDEALDFPGLPGEQGGARTNNVSVDAYLALKTGEC